MVLLEKSWSFALHMNDLKDVAMFERRKCVKMCLRSRLRPGPNWAGGANSASPDLQDGLGWQKMERKWKKLKN